MHSASEKKIRIVFMGTPDFAVASADALLQAGIEICAVVTVPDKPAGRGRKLRFSAVKEWALQQGLPLLQPQDLRDPEFLRQLRALNAHLFIVVAFRILPEEVFTIPEHGTINLHGSLLPKYRGAAPINWALINGEKETGVTTFFIDRTVDTGEILLQERTPIADEDNFGTLYARLKEIGAELLVRTVKGVMSGEITPQQQHGEATRAPKLTPELRRIDWSRTADDIHNLIRGLSPVPAAYTVLRGKRLKVLRSRPAAEMNAPGPPGTLHPEALQQGRLAINTGRGVLELLEVQPEGKKTMRAEDFLRGFHPGGQDVCE